MIMTPLAQAVAGLAEPQLIKMVISLVSDQVASLIHHSLHNANCAQTTKDEVEKLRNLEIVQLLPYADKQKVDQILNKVLEIIELVP